MESNRDHTGLNQQSPAFETASEQAAAKPEGAVGGEPPAELAAAPAGDPAEELAAVEEPLKRPRILIVHASVGSGHRSAAEAIAEAFELIRDSHDPQLFGQCDIPKDCLIEVLDILDFGRTAINGDKTASMFTGATRPIYDLTWRYTLTGRLLWGGGTIWSRVMFPAFTEYIIETEPIAIVCTHITAANVAVGSRMLTGQNYPIVCVPTDYETEGMWPHKGADMFCVATESMAETLRPRKIPDRKIAITGIPTRNAFRDAYDKLSVRRTMGLPEDKTVVLVLAGAHLPRPYVNFRKTLDDVLPYLGRFKSMHFVFIAGQDALYAEHVRSQSRDLGLDNVTVLDYVDEMAALMAACDLAICKSGGLTVTECLCACVPMILLGRAYGQENVNTRMLTSTGAALHVTTKRELIESLRHISENVQSTNAMLVNGSYLRRPLAAIDIAKATMRLVDERKEGTIKPVRKRFLWFYWGKKPAHIR